MARMQLEASLDGAPARAYALACDFPSFRQWMRDIRSIEVLERGPGWQISAWQVVRLGQTLRWRERDSFDDAARRIRTVLLDDRFFAQFALECRFLDDGPGTRLQADVLVEARVAPHLVDLIAVPLVRRNFAALTAALQDRLRAPTAAGSTAEPPR
jgi:hypothetical protein